MRTFPLALTASAVLLAAACGQPSGPSQQDPGSAPSVEAPAAPQVLEFGQAGTVTGEMGNSISVTPVGVLYHRGPYTSDLDGPMNGWYVAVALTAVPQQQDEFLAPISGGGWRWRAGGESLWGGEGNSAPWIGSVPNFTDPMPAGQPTIGIETYDVSAKGGELVYINPDDTTVVWKVPAQDTGSGMEKVRRGIERFS